MQIASPSRLTGFFSVTLGLARRSLYPPDMRRPAITIREKALTESEPRETSILIVGAPPATGIYRNARIVTEEEALESLRILQFDLVLIAINAPDESTWKFVAALRRFWPWQRWAFLSCSLTDDDQRRAYELGVCAILDALPPPDQLKRIAGISGAKTRFQLDTT